jgi:hypothetical protein
MSSVHLCDGCGKTVDFPVKLGRTIPRDYCEDCALVARKFMEGEDALRKALHENFIDDRASLIANLLARSFKLPDVPDA